ncbi:MAG: 8-amino-7-oxononanoate synthase [Acidobacteria bacterium]|nr:8-amino-7-oxononanoate synthase [Acidobacteriota bacterium]
MRNIQSLHDELSSIRQQGRYRSLRTVSSPPEAEVIIDGERLLNFSSNNYLGLATHPRLKIAAEAATRLWGTGSTASRSICGNLELHQQLEAVLASFKGSQSSLVRALLFNSGYHANTGIIPALMQDGDVIFSDALNHASIIDGSRLSRARTIVYAHRDMVDLAAKLEAYPSARRKLIVTDSVFSMDGDTAPLTEIVELASLHNAWVMVDEAHGTGVLGEQGRGLVNQLGLTDRVELQMGTLGKALGGFGAYVVAPEPFIELLINRARSFIFTTGLPPAPVAAAIEALRLIQTEPDHLHRLHQAMHDFGTGLCELGLLHTVPEAPIYPIVLGDETRTMQAMEFLKTRGIFAQGIRPPTVPAGTCRLRMTVMATHTKEHLDQALEALTLMRQKF